MIKKKFINFCIILIFVAVTIMPTVAGTCNYCGGSNTLGDTHLMDRVFADMANGSDGECYTDFLTMYS